MEHHLLDHEMLLRALLTVSNETGSIINLGEENGSLALRLSSICRLTAQDLYSASPERRAVVKFQREVGSSSSRSPMQASESGFHAKVRNWTVHGGVGVAEIS